jgi:hypothetical protein
MKYIVSDNQIEKVLELIKTIGEQYSEGGIVKTEMEVVYDEEHNMFFIRPTFHISKKGFPYHIYKHILAQKIEDYIGFPVHSWQPNLVKTYK